MRVPLATFNTAGAIGSSSRFYKRWQPARCQYLYELAQTTVDDMAARLRAHDVGIVALQETDTSFAGRLRMRQWERMADRLSMHCRFLPSFELSLFGSVRVCSGIATLSAYPIEAMKPLRFSQRGLRARLRGRLVGTKQALHCTVRIAGRPLHIVNAHLTHDSVAQREHELSTLLTYCAGLGPTLLVGDLNFSAPWRWPDDVVHPQPLDDRCMDLLRRFRDRYPGTVHVDARLGDFAPPQSAQSVLATCPSDRPRYKFDWIFLLCPDDSMTLEAETVIDYQGSDHRPVLANLVFL